MKASPPLPPSPILSHHAKWLGWTALFTAIGLLNANHFFLAGAASGHHETFLPILINELSGAWSAALLVPALLLGLRWIRQRPDLRLRLLAHLSMLVAFSLCHTSLMWMSRRIAFPAFGLGDYDYGVMSWRYLMESPNDVILYALTVCLSWLAGHYQIGRQRERRAAELEAALTEARLEALRLQLNPHFLFNALNAVSATMYEQPRAADEMLARIGELLRASLRIQAQRHRLADEWHLLELYLHIQQARFGRQLNITRELDPGLEDISVPLLVLQPLVENAIEHADGEMRQVVIKAALEDGRLRLLIHNTSRRGHSGAHHGHGIGLSNIKARLRHLYGELASLSLVEGDGGTDVRLWLPAERAA